MATAFSNQLISLSPRSSTREKHLRTATFLEAASLSSRGGPSVCYLRQFLVFSSPSAAGRSGKAAVKFSDYDAKAVDGEDDNQTREQKDLPTIRSLIQAYKDALQLGDEKKLTEIEVAICTLEKERNNLFDKFSQITTDIASGKEKFLRLNADFENFRKRSEKDRRSFTSDIQRGVMESLLPIVDSFERLRQLIKPETEQEKKLDTSYQGIYKQFVEIMRSLHVAVVETVGRQYDPLMHEAIARVESQKYKEGFVVEEVTRGFLLGEQVLRQAKVKVSAGPGVKNATRTVEESTMQTPVSVGLDVDALDSQ